MENHPLLKYFNDLILNKGLENSKAEFYTEPEAVLDFEVDKEKETISFNAPYEDQEEALHTNSFKDILTGRVNENAENIIKEIDKRMNKKNTYDGNIFLNQILNGINLLLKSNSTNQETKKYPSIKKGLIQVGNYVETMYPQSYKLENPLSKNKKSVTGFRWKKGIKDSTKVLYDLLVKNKIISTDIKTFNKAFDGSDIGSPLKIKWLILGKNGKTSKASLFYFLEELERNNIIEEISPGKTHSKLYDKIERVFANSEGNMFKNLKQSRSAGIKSNPSAKEQIDEIIQELSKTVIS